MAVHMSRPKEPSLKGPACWGSLPWAVTPPDLHGVWLLICVACCVCEHTRSALNVDLCAAFRCYLTLAA